MNRQAEIHLDVRRTQRDAASLPSGTNGRMLAFCGAILMFCAVAVGSLLYGQSSLSSEQRQQAFESLGVYP